MMVTSHPSPPRRRRHLGADETSPDHHHSRRPCGEGGPQRQAVVERAEHEQARQVRLPGQSPHPGSGGDDEAVVAHGAPVAQPDLLIDDVQALGPGPEAQVDLDLLQLLRLAQRDAIGLPLPGEHLLGQRRTVVGHALLGTDEGYRAVEAVGPQLLDRPQPGQRRSDHNDGVETSAALGIGGGALFPSHGRTLSQARRERRGVATTVEQSRSGCRPRARGRLASVGFSCQGARPPRWR